MPEQKHKNTNRLIHEKSPYLLQHAHNPVDWFPWGNEAFETAKTEDKPVFLSIGYSTCHWCHVMERESFENPEIAHLMNRTFINIKVDREERTDLDNLYMTVCQMLTGSGGWPLTIIMTPEKKPFFAGTYFPRDSMPGRLGMKQLIPRIAELWENQRTELIQSGDKITSALSQVFSQTTPGDPDEMILHRTFPFFKNSFDPERGGFGTKPKFPMPHNLSFLLRYHKRTRDKKSLHMVEKTLKEMRKGGMFDHCGFGFHRYSTDEKWLVPHFEKMLYDQALLAIAYLEAFQATGKEQYARVAREIFTYVLRDMTSSEGGFYSAEDADSEGVEGKFYVWKEQEIRNLLDEEEASIAIAFFCVETGGNFPEEATQQKTGNNILHTKKSVEEFAKEQKLSPEKLSAKIEAIRKKLFKNRKTRTHPLKDDKILTDWNGLMIAALAMGGRILENPEYTKAAEKSAFFIHQSMKTPEGELFHRFRNGEAGIRATLNDYAFFIRGLLELYETTFNADFLKDSLELTEISLRLFLDEGSGGFFQTAESVEDLIIRPRDFHDGAIPSGNSVFISCLLKISRLTGNMEYEEVATRAFQSIGARVKQSPTGFTQLLCALDFMVGPSTEIVIAGKTNAPDTEAMVRALRKPFLPNKVVLFHPEDEENPLITEISPFVKNHKSINGKAAAYICQNFSCQKPVTDAEEMMKLLEGL